MSVTRSPRPPIAQKFQCFSLPEHNKEQYVESCHTNTCAHFHCLARDNEVLLLLHNCGLHCYRRSFPVFAGSTVAFAPPFFPFPRQRMHLWLLYLSSSIACCHYSWKHGCFYPPTQKWWWIKFRVQRWDFGTMQSIESRCVFTTKRNFFLFFFGTKTKQEAFQRFENMIRFYWLLVENPKSATSCIDW